MRAGIALAALKDPAGFGRSALHAIAAAPSRPSHELCVKLLLSLGVDPEATDVAGSTALHVSATVGNVHCTRALCRLVPQLALAGIPPRNGGAGPMSTPSKGAPGDTPLHLAVLGGHVDCVSALLQSGAYLGAQSVQLQSVVAKAEARTSMLHQPSPKLLHCIDLLKEASGSSSAVDSRGTHPGPSQSVVGPVTGPSAGFLRSLQDPSGGRGRVRTDISDDSVEGEADGESETDSDDPDAKDATESASAKDSDSTVTQSETDGEEDSEDDVTEDSSAGEEEGEVESHAAEPYAGPTTRWFGQDGSPKAAPLNPGHGVHNVAPGAAVAATTTAEALRPESSGWLSTLVPAVLSSTLGRLVPTRATGQTTGEKQPTVAHLGQPNKFHYDKQLGRWVGGDEDENSNPPPSAAAPPTDGGPRGEGGAPPRPNAPPKGHVPHSPSNPIEPYSPLKPPPGVAGDLTSFADGSSEEWKQQQQQQWRQVYAQYPQQGHANPASERQHWQRQEHLQMQMPPEGLGRSVPLQPNGVHHPPLAGPVEGRRGPSIPQFGGHVPRTVGSNSRPNLRSRYVDPFSNR